MNLIERRVLEMGCVWHPTSGNVEVGIDGLIELFDPGTGEALGTLVNVQSRATDGRWVRETDDSLEYTCAQRDLDYWMSGNAPVLLILSRPNTDEAYWVSLKDYFRDPSVRAERKIRLDKARNAFGGQALAELLAVAAAQDEGLYLHSAPLAEDLYTNLIPVEKVAPRIFFAPTDLRTPHEAFTRLQSLPEDPGREWILSDRLLISFRDLTDPSWADLCDRGAVDSIATDEWATSTDSDLRNRFVRLAKQALNEKLYPQVRYHSQAKCHYFISGYSGRDRRIPYRSKSGRRSTKTVVTRFPNDRYPDRSQFRHAAAETRFVNYDDSWFLEIMPTYVFTSDGRSLHRFHADRLSGIKRIERHEAVRSWLLFWSDYLCRAKSQADLFEEQYEFLRFGPLLTLRADAGIPDGAWRPRGSQRAAAAEALPEAML